MGISEFEDLKIERDSRDLNVWVAKIGNPAGTPAKEKERRKRLEALSVADPVLF